MTALFVVGFVEAKYYFSGVWFTGNTSSGIQLWICCEIHFKM